MEFINIDKLYPHPDNPRMDLGDLTELADSIKVNGILQNITVVPNLEGNGYVIVIGHRRTAAAKLAGLVEVPCTITYMDKKTQIATMLLENMQREDLTPYEQAKGFQMCLDLGIDETELSSKTGLSRRKIKHRLKMLELDQDKVRKVQGGTIEDYIALEQIDDIEERNRLLDYVGTNNFNIELERAKNKPLSTDNSSHQDNVHKVIEKPKEVNTTNPIEEVKAYDCDLFHRLRIRFMGDVIKRKISKEEFADTVSYFVKFAFNSTFKLNGNVLLFQMLAGLTYSREDKIEKINKHRINCFVAAVYSLAEEKNSKEIYKLLNIFGYSMSDDEKSFIGD